MTRFAIFCVLACVILVLAACGASSQPLAAQQTAVAKTVVAQITADAASKAVETVIAATVIAQITQSAPTRGPSATPALNPTLPPTPVPYSPTPRPTATATPTPEIGTFANPAPIGVAVTRYDFPKLPKEKRLEMSATVLDVKRGVEADKIAQEILRRGTLDAYKTPIKDQEYLAFKVRLEVKDGPPNNTVSLYFDWHLRVRFEEVPRDGDFYNTPQVALLSDPQAGYPPISDEQWLVFPVRVGSEPLLFFQPDLIILEKIGAPSSGAYLSLTTRVPPASSSVQPTPVAVQATSRPTPERATTAAIQSPGGVSFSVVNCPQPDVRITSVTVSSERGWWNIVGTAAIPDLQYWKGEISADGNTWLMLYNSTKPVSNDLLIKFNTGSVPRNDYQMRLTAVDRSGNYPEPCVVRISTK